MDAWVSDLHAAGRTWVSWYPSRESVDPFRFWDQHLNLSEYWGKGLKGEGDEGIDGEKGREPT